MLGPEGLKARGSWERAGGPGRGQWVSQDARIHLWSCVSKPRGSHQSCEIFLVGISGEQEVFATWFAHRYKLVRIRISSMEVSVEVGGGRRTMFLALRGCETGQLVAWLPLHQLLSTEAAWAAACGQEERVGSRTGCEGASRAWGSLGTPCHCGTDLGQSGALARSSTGLAFSSAVRS